MGMTDIDAATLRTADETNDRARRIFTAGGAIGAILASTCCVVPLILVMLGISGAWIGTLTALEPYKPYVGTVAIVFIGLGFRQVYFAAGPACADGESCARPRAAVVTRTVLWLSTLVVLLALTINWWAPFLY